MNNFSHSSMPVVDQVKLQRNALVTLLMVLAIIIAFMAFKTGNLIIMAGFVALPFVLLLMCRPEVAFIIAIMLDATRMQVPGISYTTLGLIAKVIVIGSAFLATMLGQRHVSKLEVKERKPLKWFVFIIIALIIGRGSGLRMLGSETWGGHGLYCYVVRNRIFSCYPGAHNNIKAVSDTCMGCFVSWFLWNLNEPVWVHD